MLDLRLLRYFVTVAQTGSIARAAEELHVSQSPLSRQIIQFEETLGFQLFERVNKRLVLSREGQAFLKRANALLASARALDAFARDIAGGTTGRLRIGYVEGAVTTDLIGRVIDGLTALDDAAARQLEFRPMRSQAQWEALEQHEIDLGFAYSLPPEGNARLETRLVTDEPLVLAAPKGTFAPEQPIEPAQLDRQPWIAFPKAMSPVLRDRFLERCAECGFIPDIRHEAADQSLVRRLVAAGRGCAFLQLSAERLRDPAIDFYPVPWFPMRVTLHALWRAHDHGPLLGAVQKLFATSAGESPDRAVSVSAEPAPVT
ncbi:LysR family transcriptional regulator [Acidimangrovimonas pyrenivorans]|uniref:LysR family transcriptional regulator n=1 Tax=Acidimangrovimonas pyrenivorans TaxID=2030798 RepID=A0ABV7ACJ4_9RHOB